MDKSIARFKKKKNPLDVLFVNLPTYSPNLSNLDDATSGDSLTPPLGILYLSHSIKDCSFVSSYQCADFSADFKLPDLRDFLEKNSLPDFVNKKLRETVPNKPDVVAISLMFSSTYDFFQIVIEEIKKCWDDAVVIVGGVHASNTVDYLLTNNPIDYILCGEGEEAFPIFLEMIATNTEKKILGLHSLGNIKKTVDNSFEKTATVENFDIDYTTYPNVIDMEVYTSGTSMFSLSKTNIATPAFSIMSSRGCPYHCTFCASHTVQGRDSRWRDLQNVIDEIYWLNKNYGTTKYYLVDDNFVPKSKAVELFARLADVDIEGFEIVIQNMSINATDYKIIDAIIAARINYIAFAIESGSPVVQDKIKKWVKLEKAKDLVRYSQKKGLNVRCFYIIGFPGETISQMEETFKYAEELGADWSTFSVASPIPGTEMYKEFIELGYIVDGPSSWTGTSIRDRTFDTKEMTKEYIKELAYRANLKVNFVNNINMKNLDFKNAETIFTNFVKVYDFHVFAYDCLRKIYKATGDSRKEFKTIETMKSLVSSNDKARSFRKYSDLLDDEILAHLNESFEMRKEETLTHPGGSGHRLDHSN